MLEIYSEKYSAAGNIAASGAKKLLGAPPIDILEVVLREALQNSIDATLEDLGKGTLVKIRLRHLSTEQLDTLKTSVLGQLPEEDGSKQQLTEFLNGKAPVVMEICDFSTGGLSGPTRADVIEDGSTENDFCNFMLNVGSPRDVEQGGGTYGYGKSSLYLASKCSSIIVDTQTTNNGERVRRLIGSHLGQPFKLKDEARGQFVNYTGRHWWTSADANHEHPTMPLEEEQAVELSRLLGMPERSDADTGTTIAILDPVFVGGNTTDLQELGRHIADLLLWNFWPRMTKDILPTKHLNLGIEVDGVELEICAPEETPPLNLYAEAIADIRNGAKGVIDIVSPGLGNKLLGKLKKKSDLRLDSARRDALARKQEEKIYDGLRSPFPRISSHIAVMRPIELVVKYFEGKPLENDEVEWAGVFVADSAEEVEAAFAESEPPAHDDWVPDKLPSRSTAKTIVNVALREIRTHTKEFDISRGAKGDHETIAGPSLVKAADSIGAYLAAVNDRTGGAGPRENRRNGGRKGKSKPKAVSSPVFDRLEIIDGRKHAIFSVSITGGNGVTLTANPAIYADGGGDVTKQAGELGINAEVEGWKRLATGDFFSGSELQAGGMTGEFEIVVAIPDDYATSLTISTENILP